MVRLSRTVAQTLSMQQRDVGVFFALRLQRIDRGRAQCGYDSTALTQRTAVRSAALNSRDGATTL